MVRISYRHADNVNAFAMMCSHLSAEQPANDLCIKRTF